MWGLGIRMAAGAALVAAIFFAGNMWGPNGRWRDRREAEDAARNTALEYISNQEEAAGKAKDERDAVALREFGELSSGLDKCIVSPATYSALNVIRD